jgi:hypothetical protein
LLAGVWKLREITKKICAGICTLCLGKQDTKYVLMSFPQARKWRTEIVNKSGRILMR